MEYRVSVTKALNLSLTSGQKVICFDTLQQTFYVIVNEGKYSNKRPIKIDLIHLDSTSFKTQYLLYKQFTYLYIF